MLIRLSLVPGPTLSQAVETVETGMSNAIWAPRAAKTALD
jgi:hypothetical protein